MAQACAVPPAHWGVPCRCVCGGRGGGGQAQQHGSTGHARAVSAPSAAGRDGAVSRRTGDVCARALSDRLGAMRADLPVLCRGRGGYEGLEGGSDRTGPTQCAVRERPPSERASDAWHMPLGGRGGGHSPQTGSGRRP